MEHGAQGTKKGGEAEGGKAEQLIMNINFVILSVLGLCGKGFSATKAFKVTQRALERAERYESPPFVPSKIQIPKLFDSPQPCKFAKVRWRCLRQMSIY